MDVVVVVGRRYYYYVLKLGNNFYVLLTDACPFTLRSSLYFISMDFMLWLDDFKLHIHTGSNCFSVIYDTFDF